MAHCKAAHSIHALTAIGPDSLTENFSRVSYACPPRLSRTLSTRVYWPRARSLGSLRRKSRGRSAGDRRSLRAVPQRADGRNSLDRPDAAPSRRTRDRNVLLAQLVAGHIEPRPHRVTGPVGSDLKRMQVFFGSRKPEVADHQGVTGCSCAALHREWNLRIDRTLSVFPAL